MFASATFLIFTATSFWRADVAPNADYWALALLQGAGIAMYFAPLIAITLGDLSPGQMAFGSGLVNFFRITAGSFGASLATTFWQRREAVRRNEKIRRTAVALLTMPRLPRPRIGAVLHRASQERKRPSMR